MATFIHHECSRKFMNILPGVHSFLIIETYFICSISCRNRDPRDLSGKKLLNPVSMKNYVITLETSLVLPSLTNVTDSNYFIYLFLLFENMLVNVNRNVK